MKVSVCITVLNEKNNIFSVLNSLISQNKKADEIIIVDGGSTDKTPKIINDFSFKHKEIKYFRIISNIAHGRNEAIKRSKHQIVAITDANCIAENNWLNNLTRHFNDSSVDIVAGFYITKTSTPLTKMLGLYLGIHPKRYRNNFMPSARSVAFRKSVWKRVGGFDEKLNKTGEDTKYFYKCVKDDMKIVREKNARVEWREVDNMNLYKFYKKIRSYAYGDAQAGIWWHPSQNIMSHNIKILLVYFRYILGMFLIYLSLFNTQITYYLVILVFSYILWPIYKWRDVATKLKERLWLPIVQIVSDIGVMVGFTGGLIQKK